MRVLVFGDSITQGFWDTEGGWVARLRRYYDEHQVQNTNTNNEPTVFNLGISGDMTKDVLARIENEIGAHIWPDEDFCFIFSIGLNDTVYRGNEVESKPEDYEKQLEQIINISKKYSDKILFLGLSPVVDERVQPLKWSSSGKCYANSRISQFDGVLQKVCLEKRVEYLPIFKQINKEQEKRELMPDGAHPNNSGHQLIFELVRPKLDEVLAK